MHAVQATDEGRLAASGRADQSSRMVREHVQIDVEQRLGFAVEGIQVLDVNSDAHKSLRSCQRAPPDGDADG
jgi:hypothetical protein